MTIHTSTSTSEANRLIQQLPQFADFKVAQLSLTLDALLEQASARIVSITQQKENATWNNTVLPLEDCEDGLARFWTVVSHLNAVVNTPELRVAYNDNLPKITAFYTALGQNTALYDRFVTLEQSADFSALDYGQQTAVRHALRDFRLNGVHLPPAQKERLKIIKDNLASLSARFEENIMDATNDYKLFITDPAELAGIPEDVLENAAALALSNGQEGWVFTLHAPCYIPTLQYAENRQLRETLYYAYATRASEFGKPEWDNTALMNNILALRQEMATLLGFESYGALSLVTKMATSMSEVEDFLRDFASKARPFAEADVADLKTYTQSLGLPELQAWDVAFVSEKLRQQRYTFSEQEVKQFFPAELVLKGLFSLVETLFQLHIEECHVSVWHEEVRFYQISDAKQQVIGGFYLDAQARAYKRGGAWMEEAICRRMVDGKPVLPVAFLTCNFSPSIGGKPALLSHDEVQTLFHEFGHGLHHLLTTVNTYSVAGIKGVEWDAIELPSQFMENFCWEWQVLQQMSAHVDSGEPLPSTLFDKMLRAKNFQMGLQTLRQIEFALFDILLHSGFDPKQDVQALLEIVRDQVAVLRPPSWNRFAQSFGHIFAGGYAAGYYSYKWAEVLSADAYSLFEEHGVLSASMGQRYWQEILSRGGSRPALESFVAFRGRKPSLEALLRHTGMVDTELSASDYTP